MILALTGGAASGKTTAAQVFRNMGIPVLDADAISHELTARGGRALPAYRDAFGNGVFLPDGQLNRPALRKLIFQQPEERKKINQIMHPMIREELQRQIQELQFRGQSLILLDIPLLFETGMEILADRVICIYVPREMQLQRLMERDHITREQAEAMISSQMPTEEKIRRSDYAVNSNRPIEETAQIIRGIADEIMEGRNESVR